MEMFAYLEQADADEVVSRSILGTRKLRKVHQDSQQPPLAATRLQGVEIDPSKCSASCNADDAWLGVRGRPGVLKGEMLHDWYADLELLKCLVIYNGAFSTAWIVEQVPTSTRLSSRMSACCVWAGPHWKAVVLWAPMSVPLAMGAQG